MDYMYYQLFPILLVFGAFSYGKSEDENVDYTYTASHDVYNLLTVQALQIKYLSDRIERQERLISQLIDGPSRIYAREVYIRGGAYADLSVAEGLCNITMRDCLDLYLNGCRKDGVYMIDPSLNGDAIRAYCDMTSNGGGWTVIQRRVDDTVNFNRNLADYENGFGNLLGNMWIGLDVMHKLTKSDNNEVTELYVHLEDFDSITKYAKYSEFFVDDYKENFKLRVSGYYGTAGDGFAYQNGRRFTAYDFDVDDNDKNCAKRYFSGWWFGSCFNANLNGLYLHGITNIPDNNELGVIWVQWKGDKYSLKTSVMKIRRQIGHEPL